MGVLRRRIAANENSSLKFVWLSPLGPDNAAAKRIDSFGLGDRFRLVLSDEIGKERSDVLGFFMLADIFVLPSYVEGLPTHCLRRCVGASGNINRRECDPGSCDP